jgi:hypothetical protein
MEKQPTDLISMPYILLDLAKDMIKNEGKEAQEGKKSICGVYHLENSSKTLKIYPSNLQTKNKEKN